MIDWLNNNQGATNAFLTFALVIFGAATIWFSWLQKRREDVADIIVFARPHPSEVASAMIVVANVGRAHATDISLTTTVNTSSVSMPTFRIPGLNGVKHLAALLPGDRIEFNLGPGHRLLNSPELVSFGMSVEFKNKASSSVSRRSFNVDFGDWQHYQWNTPISRNEVADSVRALTATLEGVLNKANAGTV